MKWEHFNLQGPAAHALDLIVSPIRVGCVRFECHSQRRIPSSEAGAMSPECGPAGRAKVGWGSTYAAPCARQSWWVPFRRPPPVGGAVPTPLALVQQARLPVQFRHVFTTYYR